MKFILPSKRKGNLFSSVAPSFQQFQRAMITHDPAAAQIQTYFAKFAACIRRSAILSLGSLKFKIQPPDNNREMTPLKQGCHKPSQPVAGRHFTMIRIQILKKKDITPKMPIRPPHWCKYSQIYLTHSEKEKYFQILAGCHLPIAQLSISFCPCSMTS